MKTNEVLMKKVFSLGEDEAFNKCEICKRHMVVRFGEVLDHDIGRLYLVICKECELNLQGKALAFLKQHGL